MEEKIYAYYEYGEIFVGIEMNRDLSNVKIADINGVNTRLNEFNSFDEMCKILNISSNKDEWNSSFIQDFTDDEAKKLSDLILETETGIIPEEDIELEIEQTVESDSKQEIEEENSTGIETVTISHTRTEHIDRDTYESVTEIEPLNLSDQTIIKQAEATAELLKQAITEKPLKVEIVKDTSKENKKEIKNLDMSEKPEVEEYTEDNFKKDIHGGHNYKKMLQILNIKKALLLESPPGNGKTTMAKALASLMVGENYNTGSDKIEMVCFNPTTSYNDFIGGLRATQSGGWIYEKGTFTKMCTKAKEDKEHKYVFIIDEINRANTEAVIGELMAAIEQRDIPVTTNSGDKLVVPSNLYIIATMNSYDSSTKELDAATLDRFAIYVLKDVDIEASKIKPEITDTKVLRAITILKDKLSKINIELAKDVYKNKENTIGNRVLYTNYSTIDDILTLIEFDIEPKVNKKKKNLKPDEQKEIAKLLKQLVDELKDIEESIDE